MARPSASDVWTLLAACFAAFFLNLGRPGIFDLDEGLYSEAAREMLLSGDFVVPRVNNEPFFEKPPLAYWAGASSMALFGRSEWAVRLPSAVASTFTALLLLLLGARLFGRRAGLFASLAYALSPLVLGEARQLTTDALLALWMALALAALLLSMKGMRWAWALFGAATGLGILTKGIVALLLPLLAIVAYRTLRGRSGWLLGGLAQIVGAALLALLVALPWHLAAWQQGGEPFAQEYLVKQHIGRFRGGDTAHAAPFWFFVPGFLAGFFPWSFFALGALLRGRGRSDQSDEPESTEDARLLLRTWFWVVFLFFSASGSKLVSYILPLYPAAALLVGDRLARAGNHSLLIPGFAAAAAGALFAVLLAAEPLARLFGAKEDVGRAIGALQMPLTVAVGSCFAGCLSASLLARKGKSNALAPSLAWGMLGFCGAAALALTPALDGALLRDFRNVVRYAGGVASQYEALVIAPKGLRRPSALFYLPDDLVRSGRVLEGRDELARRPPGDSLLVTDDKRLGGEVVREAGAWSARALQR